MTVGGHSVLVSAVAIITGWKVCVTAWFTDQFETVAEIRRCAAVGEAVVHSCLEDVGTVWHKQRTTAVRKEKEGQPQCDEKW